MGPFTAEVEWIPSWMDDINGVWPSLPGVVEGARFKLLPEPSQNQSLIRCACPEAIIIAAAVVCS